jgi:malonyl-CoA O-methyltransferase
MLNPSDLDPQSIAVRFERLAPRIVPVKGSATLAPARPRDIRNADFYLREVERRMLERLSWTKLVPQRILDVGCGTGAGIVSLSTRFPQASVIGGDVSFGMLRAAQLMGGPAAEKSGFLSGLFRNKTASALPLLAQLESGRLPIAGNCIDLVWSNLLFHWLPDASTTVQEWHRVIRPGGLLSFTALGVDTFKELRGLGVSLMTLPDMHDIGDLLVKTGFSEPVMDQQRLVITYSDAGKLINEISSLGGHVQAGRRKGLSSDRGHKKALEALNSLKDASGKINLTTEIVFGHTWCPSQKRLADGWAPLEMKPYSKNLRGLG